MDREPVSICVVGAGASGIAAAIAVAGLLQSRGGVVVVERKDTIGKKLLATGNGRCNLTNIHAKADSYYGAGASFTQFALDAYDPETVMAHFSRLGLFMRIEEEGRVYPYTEQAASVTGLLKQELMRQRVAVLKNFEIRQIRKENRIFVLNGSGKKTVRAHRVILAAGGRARPALGSNGSGYALLESLGHRITPLFPALVQIRTAGAVEAIQGVQVKASLSLLEEGTVLETRRGNLLFTSYGVSGIPALELSRLVSPEKKQILRVDLTPDYTYEQIRDHLIRSKTGLGHLAMEDLLSGLVSRPLGQVVIRSVGMDGLDTLVSQWPDRSLEALAVCLKAFDLPVTGTNGFEEAQVTGGGASTDEFDPRTMESRLVKGLYAAGELLDVHGDCGGYNLQWAWASGLLAGESAADSLKE